MKSLRLAIDSGGCHGYQYAFSLEKEINNDEDILFPIPTNNPQKIFIVIDKISYPLLSGVEIDFVEEIIGSSFKVSVNPNASSECGCKISFQTKD
jgi:iron-sulfur cluster assembly accessory protein